MPSADLPLPNADFHSMKSRNYQARAPYGAQQQLDLEGGDQNGQE